MAKRFTGRCRRCRKFVKKVDHHPSGECGVCRGVVAPADPRRDAERMRGAFFPRRGNPLVLAPGAISFAALAGMNPPMTEQQAMAWLEKVGSWPSSDPEVQRRTAEAERVLRGARHRGNPPNNYGRRERERRRGESPWATEVYCDHCQCPYCQGIAMRAGARMASPPVKIVGDACMGCGSPRSLSCTSKYHADPDAHRTRGNPVYPVRTATTPPFPHPPAGYVDAPDIFAADRMARSQFGSSAKFGVGYDNLARAKAREESGCGCRHGTSPEGYPFLERCPMHLAQANAGRMRNPLEVATASRSVVHRVATAKSRKAKCGETDGSASVHASQVTCPDCKKRKKRKK